MRPTAALLPAFLLCTVSGHALAQATPAPTRVDEDGATIVQEVVVTAPRGQVQTTTPPDLVLDAEAVQAYGASSISELVEALAPQLQSGRGRSDGPPVFLVNARRISGFREIQGIPPEAIERVEIFPETVALQYGYAADQRVINFVLKANFKSLTLEGSERRPTEGGRSTEQLRANVLTLGGPDRRSFDVELNRDSPLFEQERDIVRSPGLSPYDRVGNISGVPYGAEIDPALSTLAGRIALLATVPVTGATRPLTLSDFASGAGAVRTDDLTARRTLLGASDRANVGGSITHDIGHNTAVTLSGSLTDTESTSWLGLPSATLTLPVGNPYSPFGRDVLVYRYFDDPSSLMRTTDTLNAQAGVAANGFIKDWRWTVTGNYTRVQTDTDTGRGLDTAPFQAALAAGALAANPFGALPAAYRVELPHDTAHSVSTNAEAQLVLNGTVRELAAGRLNATVTLGATHEALDSESLRSGVIVNRDQSRDTYEVETNLNLPVASRRREVRPALGELSFQLNLGYRDLSDFGGLSKIDAGVDWSPIDPLSFSANFTREQGAPTVSQLNDPVISTPNVQVFDFVTGQTVSLTRINGGNPNLAADDRTVLRLGAQYKPFTDHQLTFSANYTRTEIQDQIATFPTITPSLEQAFPTRFVRDGTGRLVSIDVRPVNYDSAEKQDVRLGFNFFSGGGGGGRGGRGGGGPRGGMSFSPGGPPPGGGGDGGGPPPGGGMGALFGRQPRGPQPARWQLSAYYTYRFQDEITIRSGLPVLDLLDGASVSNGGGTSRQELQVQAGWFKAGTGVRATANWQSGTFVDGGTGDDLTFSDRTTVGVQLFSDLGQRQTLVHRYPFLRGTRLTLGIDNLLDDHLDVTNSSGVTPQGYQADYLDPLGRTVRIGIRKILF